MENGHHRKAENKLYQGTIHDTDINITRVINISNIILIKNNLLRV